MAAERTRPDPYQLAAGAEGVHPGGRVRAHPARQDVALPHLGGERHVLKWHECLAQAVFASALRWCDVDPLPCRQQPGERALLGGLDLLAIGGERRSPQPPQDLRVAPLALHAVRAQLPADELARALELAQHRGRVHAVALRHLGGGERTGRVRVAVDQPP